MRTLRGACQSLPPGFDRAQLADQLDVPLIDGLLAIFERQPVLVVARRDTADLLGLPPTIVPDTYGAADPPTSWGNARHDERPVTSNLGLAARPK